jgi:hypothetical protein
VAGGSTICEVVTGGRAVLRLPACELGAGEVVVALDVEAHFEGDEPYTPLLEADTGVSRRLPPLRSGERQRIEGRLRIAEPGRRELSVIWPDRRALVAVYGVDARAR